MSRKIDLSRLAPVLGTLYPAPFDEPCRQRRRIRIGDGAGLTQFGVNLCTLPPGVWSSQRLWHMHSDELVYIVSGEVVLVTDAGDEILRAVDFAGFKAGDSDGHCLQNRSENAVVILEIGTRRDEDHAFYSDIDMMTATGIGATASGTGIYFHRDGTPYPSSERKA